MREPPYCHKCGKRLSSVLEVLHETSRRFNQRLFEEGFRQVTRAGEMVKYAACELCGEPLSVANQEWWQGLKNRALVALLDKGEVF